MNSDIRKCCVELMESADCCYLTTLDESGSPCTRAVFNLRNREQYPDFAAVFAGHESDLLLYIGTNTSSRKVAQVRKDPRVSVYYCKPKDTHGTMLSGRMRITDSPDLRHSLWVDGWIRYYPPGPR